MSDEAKSLLGLIDGSSGFGRGLRTYPNAKSHVRRDTHALALELRRLGLIYRRPREGVSYFVWSANQ